MRKDRARHLRRNMTDAEKRLWGELRNKALGGFKFRRQAPVGRYVVDFVCHGAMLIVEVDGGQHAMESHRDATRTMDLEAAGFRVLRFWNNEVLQNTDGVLQEILRVAKKSKH